MLANLQQGIFFLCLRCKQYVWFAVLIREIIAIVTKGLLHSFVLSAGQVDVDSKRGGLAAFVYKI